MAADVSQWDETICDKALCQHPQCWDTLRRVEEGHPRIRFTNSRSISRMLMGSEDVFPTLKIVNVPPGQSLRRCIRCSRCHRTFSISAAPSPLNSVPQDGLGEDSAVSSERPVFPGLNSTAGSNEMSFVVLSNIGRLRMFPFPEIAPPKQGCSSESGNLIVKWVPSKHRPCQKAGQQALPELKPVRQISVKDLASESLIDLKEVQSQGADLRRTKSKKTLAGGQRNLSYPKRSQLLSYPSKTTKSLVDCKTEGFAEEDGILSQSCPERLQIANIVELQDEGALKLMNRQPGFPHAKSKSSRPLLVQKAPVMVNLKEKNAQGIKTSQYMKKPIKIKTRPGRVPLRLLSKLEEQLDCLRKSAFPAEFLQRYTDGGHQQPSGLLATSPKTFAERVRRGEENPVVQLVDVWRRRPPGKSVLGKSCPANLVPLGVEEHGQPLTSAGSWDNISCRCAVSREDDAWALCCCQGAQSAGRAVPLFKEEFEDDSSYKTPPPPPPSPCPQEDYDKVFSERKFLPFEGLSSTQGGCLC
ncbi:uncharacterized protein C9orf43 homolog [Nothoprocta perdicaria]|uniref:uncharacterized protein C9orf43 homolog n=1 Tax=Nothoprocta perdicaria TaxID=30464 RepID=UPI000E1BDD4B|nr:uncharacterized protein C9orf43 homolog [Nothoprocta perdicaria]